MEERKGFAFAGTEQLTVIGKPLHVGDPAPDFRLDYLDLTDMAVRTVGPVWAGLWRVAQPAAAACAGGLCA